jgi:hypothetical protein
MIDKLTERASDPLTPGPRLVRNVAGLGVSSGIFSPVTKAANATRYPGAELGKLKV